MKAAGNIVEFYQNRLFWYTVNPLIEETIVLYTHKLNEEDDASEA